MAGSGRRTFTPGEVLTASNVMNYLQDQAVMNFAGTAARGSAIGSAVSQGMVSYLDDSNSLEVYKTVGTAVAGWEPVNLAQSPNVIINGAFDIWQRGTSFTANNAYTADRWLALTSTYTLSRQTSGLTGFQFCLRYQRPASSTSTANFLLEQPLETSNSVALAGKTVTVSFYARAGADYSPSGSGLTVNLTSGTGTDQNRLLSGYTGAATVVQSTVALTTSWQRFSATGVVGSSATELSLYFVSTPTGTAGANDWFEIDGVQLEAGSTATPFRRNANSIQGELAACRRYFQVYGNSPSGNFTVQSGIGTSFSTSQSVHVLSFDTPMRTTPSLTSSTASTFQVDLVGVTSSPVSNISFDLMTENMTRIVTTFTTNGSFGSHKAVVLAANNSANARIYASAEL